MNNYLMIENNVVTNVCVWDGNSENWQPPQDSLMLLQETMPTKIWGLVDKEYQLIDSIGNASVGFTYDGSVCITNEVKPVFVEVSLPRTII